VFGGDRGIPQRHKITGKIRHPGFACQLQMLVIQNASFRDTALLAEFDFSVFLFQHYYQISLFLRSKKATFSSKIVQKSSPFYPDLSTELILKRGNRRETASVWGKYPRQPGEA
jgi:hypothetical protein